MNRSRRPSTPSQEDTDIPLDGQSISRVDMDVLSLATVAHGRMFCTSHGRQCYRRATILDGNYWICPDERHIEPIE